MAERRPLVDIAGVTTELPIGDTLPGSGGSTAPELGTKTLVYTNGLLTGVNGPLTATKTLIYSSGLLTSVSSTKNAVTINKALGYTGNKLTSVITT